MIRRFLDFLYRGSGALAAGFLVAICVIVLLQVCANIVDAAVKLVTGEPIGLVIPSYAEFAGFFLAASSFLALAHTLRKGGHIRVNLLIQRLVGGPRRWIELWCIGAAALMSGFFALWAINLTLESFEFGDVSYGMIPVPLWIPQTAVSLGVIMVTVALVDEFFSVLNGARPTYEGASDRLHLDGDGEPNIPAGR